MDDEAMGEPSRREARRRRRQTIGLWGFAAGLALLVFPLVALDTAGPALRLGLYVVMALGLIVGLAGFAVAARYMRDANAERVAMRGGYRDRVQREYVESVGFLPIACLLMNFQSLRSTWTILGGRGDVHHYAFAVLGLMTSLLILQMVAGLNRGQDRLVKRLLDEEIIISFRRRALNLGLGVATAGLVVGFAAGLYDPAWGVMAMLITLAATAATAAFRFAHLNREADPHD